MSRIAARKRRIVRIETPTRVVDLLPVLLMRNQEQITPRSPRTDTPTEREKADEVEKPESWKK
jgi:hypothetical protein